LIVDKFKLDLNLKQSENYNTFYIVKYKNEGKLFDLGDYYE